MVNGIAPASGIPAAGPNNPNGPKSAAEMQNQFLTLLVAQLQNQDPTNPTDNAQITSQMAQISTVSGIEKLNGTMTDVNTQMSTMQMMQGVGMVGRSVLAEGNSMAPAAGSDRVYTAAFDLGSSASNVEVEITNGAGQLLDTVRLGSGNPGRNFFTWDTSQYMGDKSQLKFNVRATNGENPVPTTRLSPCKVVSASTTNGQLMLDLSNGASVAYAHVKAVY